MEHWCFCVSFVSHALASIHCSLVVTCWESAGLMALVNFFLLLAHVLSWVRCGT